MSEEKGLLPEHAARETSPGKFEGERACVRLAHERSLEGFAHDDFYWRDDYYARVLFDASPWIVCFREDAETGFVRELTNSQYEAASADYQEEKDAADDGEMV